MQEYKVLIPTILLADKVTKASKDEVVQMDPEDRYTKVLLNNGMIELVLPPVEEKKEEPKVPETPKKYKKFWQNHEVLDESTRRVSGVTWTHLKLGNGTECDVAPADYQRDVRVSHIEA